MITIATASLTPVQYKGICATPTFSPASGNVFTTISGSVTITCSSPAGASIYYTTDGSTPTTSSTLYTGAVSIAKATTIKAIATHTQYYNSPVGSASYTFLLTFSTSTTWVCTSTSVTVTVTGPG